eukprot:gene13691-15386_t
MRAMLIGRAGWMVRIGRAMISVRRLWAASRIVRGLHSPGLCLGRAAFSGIMFPRARIAPGIGPAVASGCGMLRARIVMPRVARALRGPGLCLGRVWIVLGIRPALSLVEPADGMMHARGASGVDPRRGPIAARGEGRSGLCLGRGRRGARGVVMIRRAAPELGVWMSGRARVAVGSCRVLRALRAPESLFLSWRSGAAAPRPRRPARRTPPAPASRARRRRARRDPRRTGETELGMFSLRRGGRRGGATGGRM